MRKYMFFFFFFPNKHTRVAHRKKKQGSAILAELNAEFPDLNLIWKLAHELRIIMRITRKAVTWTG